jgi:hypothetical protein
MQFPHGTRPSLEQPRHSILWDEHAEPCIQDKNLTDLSSQSRLSRIVRGPRAQSGDANRRTGPRFPSLWSPAQPIVGSELQYAEHQELAKSCTAVSPGIVTAPVCHKALGYSGGDEGLFGPDPTTRLVPWYADKPSRRRKRIRMNVKIIETYPRTKEQAQIALVHGSTTTWPFMRLW